MPDCSQKLEDADPRAKKTREERLIHACPGVCTMQGTHVAAEAATEGNHLLLVN